MQPWQIRRLVAGSGIENRFDKRTAAPGVMYSKKAIPIFRKIRVVWKFARIKKITGDLNIVAPF
jgi:hypothetical protein